MNRGYLRIYLSSICLYSPAVLEPLRQGQKNWMHIKHLFSVTSANNYVWVLSETEKEDGCIIQLFPIKVPVHGKSENAPQMQKREIVHTLTPP